MRAHHWNSPTIKEKHDIIIICVLGLLLSSVSQSLRDNKHKSMQRLTPGTQGLSYTVAMFGWAHTLLCPLAIINSFFSHVEGWSHVN